MAFIKIANIHKSWEGFLVSQTLDELSRIEKLVGKTYTPSPSLVLRFLSVDITKVKIIILGQDPYPQPGVATGRAFEVGGLNRWNDKFRQSSLKNILKLLYKSYNNELVDFNRLIKKILDNEFVINDPPNIFSSWEKQGVMLLNRYFTCIPNSPKSHRTLWMNFSNLLIDYIHLNNKNIIWFLWGRESKEILNYMDPVYKYISDHPMLINPNKGSSFINSRCFTDTKEIINWLNYK